MRNLTVLSISSVLILLSISGEASAANAPDPPTNLAATAVSPTQVNLFWSAPANDGGASITGYKIEYKIGSNSYSILVANTASTATSYFHSGLTAGQQYTYKVSAINSAGTGAASGESSATPTSSSTGTYPGAPSGLVAYAVSPTQVNLHWSAPSSNGGHPISGYKIEFRIGSGSYSTLISNTGSTSTTYNHQGLTTNQVYFYRVYAITSFGTSQSYSNEAYAQPQSSSTLTAPGTPTGVTATAVSPTQITLSWSAPSNTGGAPISGYKIESKSGSGSYSTLISNTGSTSTVYSHTGLATGTTYTYKVSAINSAGTGAASGEASATPQSSSSAGVPSQPLSLTATAASSTQVNLSWSAPSSNGGYPISGYKIEFRIGSGSYSTLISNTGSTSTAYSHTGLSSGQTYVYRVSAINSVGAGTPSAESSVTLTGASSSNAPGAPVGLAATAASPTQVNLSWSAPSNTGGSAVTGYKIEAKKGNTPYDVLVANTQSTATSFSHTGLTTGSTYYYRVSAINSVGTGPSSEASATPKETVSPALTATAVSPTSITLSWIPPSQTYKQAITGYKIQEKIAADTFKVIVDNTGSTATSYTITGLTTGNTYTYVVSAYFTLGSSPISNDASAKPETTSVPPASQPTLNPPGAPIGLSASPISPTIVNLSWSAPSSTGGASITGYKIEVKKGTGAYETLVSSTNSTTKYSHTGLTTGTTYTYKVYAINSVGIGPASAESSATPVLSSSQPPTSTANKPGAPVLGATRISPTQINLSWSAPSSDGGATITGYKIEYKIGTNSYLTLTSKAVGTTYSHTGLLPNTYSYRVSAINSAGTGTASNEISIPAPATDVPKTEEPPAEEPPKLASFVDPKKDPMHYVNRYNNEPVYKEWFDRNFPEMTIYEAVGLPNPEDEVPDFEPPPPESIKTRFASFVDETQDPMHYVNRYNSELPYREWFDATFPGESIYEAVGLPDPSKQNNTSQCGAGTHLENGICVLDEKGGGCLIATAAYGTEMAPQVQMLREVRDNVLFGTSSGTAFMAGFNSFYYSFSPSVANLERQNPAFKEAVKVALTPMLSTLSILSYVDIDSESEMLGYGIGIILLNAGMYLVAPALAVVAVRKLCK